MAKSYDMTWVASRSGWMKDYKGKQYAVSCRQLRKLGYSVLADTKAASGTAANQWWESKRQSLETQTPTINAAASVLSYAADSVGHAAKFLGEDIEATRTRAKKKVDTILGDGPVDPDCSIAHHLERYRSKAIRDTAAGIIKPGRFVKIKNSLDWIAKFFEGEGANDIATIKADTLDNFYAWDRANVKGKKYAISTARDHFQVFRVWVQWLAESGLIPLPLNITSKRFKFVIPKVKYNYWTSAEFQTIYTKAHDRLKLYLGLIANCGFYASDIGNLLKSEVDLKAGTITRQRTKTGEQVEEGYEPNGNVPVVTYFLWPETLKLLKSHWSDDKTLAITNEDGGPLWKDGVREDGRYFKTDNIVSCYKRWLTNHPQDTTNTLENIRKTSAQFLSDSEYRDCANLFGGWAEKETRTKHYTEITSPRFQEALKYLRKCWGY